jgi:hypothetical protein
MLGRQWEKMVSSGKIMLLTGTFHRSLTKRTALPFLRLDALGPAAHSIVLYVAPGTDGSLALYGEDAFSRMANHLV